MSLLRQASCVSVDGRGVLIEGASGTGKSSLVLALIDRGAMLVSDDGVSLESRGGVLHATPPPNIEGLLEVRNVGLVTLPVAREVPVALALRLDRQAPRFIDAPEALKIADVILPLVRLWPDSPVLHLRAERALELWGLSFSATPAS